MMQMDRETLMMIATIVAVAGVIFLFREMNKTKAEVENFRNFSSHVMQHLATAPEAPQEEEKTPKLEQVEEKVEE